MKLQYIHNESKRKLSGGLVHSYLGIHEDELKEMGGVFTAREIAHQPSVWRKTKTLFLQHLPEITSFLDNVFSLQDLNIILTGAGTSAFIGDVLQGPMQKLTGKTVQAVATTDMVTHPRLYLKEEQPTLLISFARSGNSPESIKSVQLAEQLCRNIYHFIITCNMEGNLAKNATGDNTFVFLLPPESDDKSLAMTSSFTSMLLSGLFLASYNDVENLSKEFDKLIQYAAVIFDRYLDDLRKVALLDFDRAVFLGSGLFQGIARESHLKLQELSDGKVICKYDTFLGFRHGPKAVINNKTLLAFLFSNDSYVRLYEKDLVNDINNGEKGIFRIGVMEDEIDVDVDLKIILNRDKKVEPIRECMLTVVSVIPAQVIGFFKSMYLGLKPDSPSESGTITRVVRGVRLYSYEEETTYSSTEAV
ncbi:MAG TPA: SIS domain-containing protein [Caldithrix abyssi]|uniref:SIS domain-containing protein n=1 Tax=Caldithrix abyssi TaxID=187145 RepID=A0A7V4TZD3_CALAY|nr:SIS domain-containing protein [Caldithrix abyssi]